MWPKIVVIHFFAFSHSLDIISFEQLNFAKLLLHAEGTFIVNGRVKLMQVNTLLNVKLLNLSTRAANESATVKCNNN